MTTATLAPNLHQGARPQSFTPPGDRAVRLSHLDPRPLWLEPVAAQSAWKSPGFIAACAIVLPLAAVVAPVRALLRLF